METHEEAQVDGVDLALVTHNHPDHFDAGMAVRFLEAQPGFEPVKHLAKILTAEKHPRGQMAIPPDGKYYFFIRSYTQGFVGDQVHFY